MAPMQDLNKKEWIIRYGVAGFVLGVSLLIFTWLMLFAATGARVTPGGLALLHSRFWFLYLADILPLAGALAGALTGSRHFSQLGQLHQRIREEAGKKSEIRRFTQSLIEGDLNTGITFAGPDQSLTETLNKLKDTLVRNRELERTRRQEEQQRNWVSEGLARFGDILRTRSGDLEAMSYELIASLVRYLDANQGALFMAEEKEGEQNLRMIACHAYERRKYPDKVIRWGDGLIGAVAMERKGFYTSRIPDGYLTITSGLGKANPGFLLLEPLVWNDRVFGIIELASFKHLDTYKIQFVSRLAENIATTIHTMESSLRTEQLLRETRAQAEQLARQEEQVRQNMEALKIAQEEAARQAEIFISFTNTVNHTLMRAEYDTGGRLLYANTRFLKKMGYSGNREVEGKHISMFINDKDLEWFNALWNKLSRGGRHFEGYMKHETRLGQDLWTMATYTCMRRDDGSVEKILFLAIDSTEQKKQSLDYEGQIEAIDRLNAKAVFSPGGKLTLSNQLFRKTLKYTEMELEQMNVFDFFTTGEQERVNEIWEKVIRGEAFQGQLRMRSRYEEELWFRATLLSVDDMYGEVEKVIFLASEITKEKEMEMAAHRQHEQLVGKEEELRLAGLDLKKKLDETSRLRKQDKEKLLKEVRKYIHLLEELPFPVITVNNRGFVLFFNREAEKTWGMKQKEVLGTKSDTLFQRDNASEVLLGFTDPGKSKRPGIHGNQRVVLPDGNILTADLFLVRTDLKDELHYSLILLPATR